MKLIKRILICGALLVSMTNVLLTGEVKAVSNSSGVGLSAHCIKAYNEHWQYSYGSAVEGCVDCSGLIWSYNGVGGNRCDMLSASSEWGYVSNGIPRIHGLGLHQPGHVGVYIGSNQAMDARDYGINCVLHDVYSKNWVEWFKIAGVSYPNTGWVFLNGQAFYYENGQYIVDTQREFDGVTYTFNSFGVSDILPPDNVYTETDYSNIRVITESQIDYAAIAEEERLVAARRAEEERIAAEEERIEAEKKAEEERLVAEKKAEEERLVAEKKAEEERIAAEKKAEEERIAMAKKAFEDRKKELQLKRERKIKREIAAEEGIRMSAGRKMSLSNGDHLLLGPQERHPSRGRYRLHRVQRHGSPRRHGLRGNPPQQDRHQPMGEPPGRRLPAHPPLLPRQHRPDDRDLP